MKNGKEIYIILIKEYINKIELGDKFDFDDLLKYANITRKVYDKDYNQFITVFNKSKEYKTLTKINKRHSKTNSTTEYMKTS